jgi:hypothetical protein
MRQGLNRNAGTVVFDYQHRLALRHTSLHPYRAAFRRRVLDRIVLDMLFDSSRFASNGFVARFELHGGTRATHMPEQIDVRKV